MKTGNESGVKRVARGARALFETQVRNRRVSPGLAKNRAAICARCEENRKDAESLLESFAVAVVEKLDTAEPTGFEDVLGICNKCGCALRALVHTPRQLLGDPGKDLPTQCWKRKP